MISKVLVTIGALIYGLAVPILEIDATHVFNPQWPAHARLHEVWQLATNSAIAVFCLWLTWIKDNVRLPSTLALFITGGFLFAYLIRNMYGGSMLHTDGTERTLLGLNIGVLGFGLVIIMSVIAILLDRSNKHSNHTL